MIVGTLKDRLFQGTRQRLLVAPPPFCESLLSGCAATHLSVEVRSDTVKSTATLRAMNDGNILAREEIPLKIIWSSITGEN